MKYLILNKILIELTNKINILEEYVKQLELENLNQKINYIIN